MFIFSSLLTDLSLFVGPSWKYNPWVSLYNWWGDGSHWKWRLGCFRIHTKLVKVCIFQTLHRVVTWITRPCIIARILSWLFLEHILVSLLLFILYLRNDSKCNKLVRLLILLFSFTLAIIIITLIYISLKSNAIIR